MIGPSEYQVGTMSRITGKRLTGYSSLPEWTDEPTDSSLRETEVPQIVEPPRSVASTPRVATPLSAPLPAPAQMSNSIQSLPRSMNSSSVASPVGSVPQATATKGRFKDLDKFLDSESETEEESDEESEEEIQPRAVTAPPRSAIVPEYDEDSESEEDVSEEEEDSDEEDNVRKPLYDQYR